MGRIRSIHPGFFTDENYMVLSMAARAALPGIWTECDDNGVFEWKPIVLKAKLFPADNVDMSAILGELSENRWIKRIEADGKPFGLVRNFRKWQRPEKPKDRHPLPDEHRCYVGLKPTDPPPVADQSPTDPPPVADQSPTDPRKSPQREEEGGRREEEGIALASDTARAQGEPPEMGNPISAHSQVCIDLLDNRAADLDAWENDFLISVKWADRLTKAQSDKLKSIQDRLASKPREPPRVPQVKVFEGTPAWMAWQATGKKFAVTDIRDEAGRIRRGWYFPTEFPPAESEAA